jgi:hypothetical protein
MLAWAQPQGADAATGYPNVFREHHPWAHLPDLPRTFNLESWTGVGQPRSS